MECLGGRRSRGKLEVGPWQYQSEAWAGLVPVYYPSRYPAPVPTRYTTLPVPTYPHPVPHARDRSTRTLRLTKEILGVNNAHRT